MTEPIKVAIIGFGGIARAHYTSYVSLENEGEAVKVVAVVDKNADQFKNNSSINLGAKTLTLSDDVHTYSSLDALLDKEEFDLADVCLPSFLHKEFSVRLMRAKKQVLCEKPMALNSDDCEEMVRVAKEEGTRLMVGQCLRFEPAYLFLKECVDSAKYGKLKYMSMHRLSEYPTWSAGGWFNDKSKCGGCITDTHIHDIDIARFILGEPLEVSCVAYDNIPHCQLVNSRLFYEGATVVIDGAWDESLPTPFSMGYAAKFEHASVYYDGNRVTVYGENEAAEEITLPEQDRIVEEIRYLLKLIEDKNAENTRNSPESAAKSVKLAQILADSAEHGGKNISIKEK